MATRTEEGERPRWMPDMNCPRLSWGAGPEPCDGWHRSDARNWPENPYVRGGADHVGPIQDGLPWPDGTFVGVVSFHALQMVPYRDLRPALTELRRVTRPGGWIRVGVPDFLGAVDAFRRHDPDHFRVADRIAPSLAGKLCVYVTQAGSTRSVFTGSYLRELLADAGWLEPISVWPGVTRSPWPWMVELDNRADETIIVEAYR